MNASIIIDVPHTSFDAPEVGKPLTPQQKLCIQGIFEGRTNKEIAQILGLNQGTVRNYIKNAYAKLGINNVRQLFPLLTAAQFELRTGTSLTQ